MKTDLDEFAKEVLWQLALARAEIQEVKLLTAELLVLETGKTGQEILNHWQAKKEAGAKVFFLKSAKAAGFGTLPIPDHNGEMQHGEM